MGGEPCIFHTSASLHVRLVHASGEVFNCRAARYGINTATLYFRSVDHPLQAYNVEFKVEISEQEDLAMLPLSLPHDCVLEVPNLIGTGNLGVVEMRINHTQPRYIGKAVRHLPTEEQGTLAHPRVFRVSADEGLQYTFGFQYDMVDARGEVVRSVVESEIDADTEYQLLN